MVSHKDILIARLRYVIRVTRFLLDLDRWSPHLGRHHPLMDAPGFSFSGRGGPTPLVFELLTSRYPVCSVVRLGDYGIQV